MTSRLERINDKELIEELREKAHIAKSVAVENAFDIARRHIERKDYGRAFETLMSTLCWADATLDETRKTINRIGFKKD